jgi:hypothetical protein
MILVLVEVAKSIKNVVVKKIQVKVIFGYQIKHFKPKLSVVSSLQSLFLYQSPKSITLLNVPFISIIKLICVRTVCTFAFMNDNFINE